jgi:hypothetical protein
MRGPLAYPCSIRPIPSRSRSASSRMHRGVPRTQTRHSSPANTVVYVCNSRENHPTQRPVAVFTLVTRFRPAAGARHSRSVLERPFDRRRGRSLPYGGPSLHRRPSAPSSAYGRRDWRAQSQNNRRELQAHLAMQSGSYFRGIRTPPSSIRSTH